MSSTDPPNESFAALFEGSVSAQAARKRFHRGDRLDVKVVAIGKDAVFVDLGGKQEGYFDRVEALGEGGKLTVEVGSSLSAVVVKADGERVKLSPVFVRAKAEDGSVDMAGERIAIPRARSGPMLIEGGHVKGTISGIERYGLFVQIEGTHGRSGRGLVPTAETGAPRGQDLHKVFSVGAPVEAKILAIQEDGKIRLSIRALSADAERQEFEAYSKAQESAGSTSTIPPPPPGGQTGKPQGKVPKPAPIKSLGTLGDLLAKHKR